MKQYDTKVWLPNNNEDTCNNGPEICQFFCGGYCLLLSETMASRDNIYFKLEECPAKPPKSKKE